jgi:hypothetical protein
VSAANFTAGHLSPPAHFSNPWVSDAILSASAQAALRSAGALVLLNVSASNVFSAEGNASTLALEFRDFSALWPASAAFTRACWLPASYTGGNLGVLSPTAVSSVSALPAQLLFSYSAPPINMAAAVYSLVFGILAVVESVVLLVSCMRAGADGDSDTVGLRRTLTRRRLLLQLQLQQQPQGGQDAAVPDVHKTERHALLNGSAATATGNAETHSGEADAAATEEALLRQNSAKRQASRENSSSGNSRVKLTQIVPDSTQ